MQQHGHHQRQPVLPVVMPRFAATPLRQHRPHRTFRQDRPAIGLILIRRWLATMCNLRRMDDGNASRGADDCGQDAEWRLNPAAPERT
jgi:hypothetical protein